MPLPSCGFPVPVLCLVPALLVAAPGEGIVFADSALLLAPAGSRIPLDPGTRARLETVLGTKLAGLGPFHGSILVARGEEIVLHRSAGLADAATGRPMPSDALWDWASVTKQFTAAAFLVLQQRGVLSLDDPLARWLPGTPSEKQGITLRHMLTHTSGVDLYATVELGDGSKEDVLRSFLLYPMVAAPGTRFEYNNHAYCVMAAVLERASGRRYEDFLVANLFRPAGMADASFIGMPGLPLDRLPLSKEGTGPRFAYGDELAWGYRGAGGALASVLGMWRWDRALRGDAILDARSRTEAYRPLLEGYALGWQLLPGVDETLWTHGGSVAGVSTYYLRGSASEVVVVIAMSRDDDQGKVPEMADALYRVLAGMPRS